MMGVRRRRVAEAGSWATAGGREGATNGFFNQALANTINPDRVPSHSSLSVCSLTRFHRFDPRGRDGPDSSDLSVVGSTGNVGQDLISRLDVGDE
ncbi:hypothetical protein J6590_012287 [Homalodisca vitripennis]|nr:hypothetical protein J6590_012287 [Homalodisca vitripennis]